MRVILHIGTEKTGTSTIQRFMQINRRIFQEHGILAHRIHDGAGFGVAEVA
jgi:hypothetical protein